MKKGVALTTSINLPEWAIAMHGSYESKFVIKNLFYKSKFILDSFIFRVSPARFLRWFAAIVDFSTRSRVCSCDLFGINQVRFLKWLDSIVDFFTQSHDFSRWVWCAENHVRRRHPNYESK